MPQDSPRSVYRSFLTCDDPKGVVECKTVRKSRRRKDIHDQRKGCSSTSTSCEEESRTENISKGSSDDLQKLSNSERFGKQPEYIAKDLLKGALDLEESLIMLGKLQQASDFMGKPKIRHKEMSQAQGGRDDKMTNSYSFGDNDWAVSTHHSSWDCYDELRDVIMKSFARQNLLPKDGIRDRKGSGSDYCMDFPSTSSSNSSSTWFQSSEVEHGKPKAPNLIAKLMGLEGTPRKAMSSRELDEEKFHNQASCLLDIDLAKPRKPPFVVRQAEKERTLEEMIETMQFKGLLERRIDGSDCCGGCSDDPPIVVMRPVQVPDLRIRRYQLNYSKNKEKPINCNDMPGKRMKEFPPSVLDRKSKIPDPNGKLQPGRTLQKKIKQSVEPSARVIKKSRDIPNNRPSMKESHRKPLDTEVQKSGVSAKRIGSIVKMASNKKIPSQTEGVISLESGKPAVQSNTTTLKLGKAARGPNISKEHVARSKNSLEINMNTQSTTSSIPKKNLQKAKSDSKRSTTLVKIITSGDNLQTTIESHILEPIKRTTPQNCTKEIASTTYDYTGDASSSSHGTTVMDDVRCIEDSGCSPCPPNSDENGGCKSIVDAKDLLSSSVSFLNHAKELFNTRPHDAFCMLTAGLPDCELLDASVLVKCGEELLHRKGLEHAMKISPLPQNLVTSPKRYSSLEQLAAEISAEIEELRNLSKSSGEMILSDIIYSMLERDLYRKGESTGPWDSGWKNGVALDGINEVMDDVEKLVLCELVDDLIMQLI